MKNEQATQSQDSRGRERGRGREEDREGGRGMEGGRERLLYCIPTDLNAPTV